MTEWSTIRISNSPDSFKILQPAVFLFSRVPSSPLIRSHVRRWFRRHCSECVMGSVAGHSLLYLSGWSWSVCLKAWAEYIAVRHSSVCVCVRKCTWLQEGAYGHSLGFFFLLPLHRQLNAVVLLLWVTSLNAGHHRKSMSFSFSARICAVERKGIKFSR